MRPLSFVFAAIAILPILLIFGGWVWPLSAVGAENWAHIRENVLGEYFINSVLLKLCVAFFAGSMGVVCAWMITRFEFPLKTLWSWMLVLPFAMPSFLLAMSYGDIFEYAGPVQSLLRDIFGWKRGDYYFPPIRSLLGAALVLSFVTFPYVYLLARAAFERQPNDWMQISSIYGHQSRLSHFWISFGAARPFIAAGVALAIMEAAADIGVTQLFGVPTLATGLFRIWYFGDDPMVAARLASILILIAATLLLIERYSRRRARFSASGAFEPIQPQAITGKRKWLVSALVGAPVILGFVIPLIWTIRLAIFSNRHFRFEKVWSAFADSLLLAFIGAVTTITAAWIINSVERENPRLRFQWLASLGYAVPGIVIAFSLLIIQRIFAETLDWRLIMTGSIFGLILAYLIRFFSPAYQNLHSGFMRITPEMDMMAKSFGKSKLQIFRDIHLPLMRTPIFHAAILVSIDILKELPATLVLRPFDITPLAVVVFEFAGDGRPAEAAPYALILIAVTLTAVYVLNRLQKRIEARGAKI